MEVFRGRQLAAEEQTIPEAIATSFDRYPDQPAVRYSSENRLVDVTYGELQSQVESLASHLRSMGLERGEKCFLMADTRPEWLLADLAILFVGGITVTAFPTLPYGLFEYHVRDSGSGLLILENQEHVQKFQRLEKERPGMRVVVIDPVGNLPTLESMLTSKPSAEESKEFRRHWRQLQPQDIASIIYTSGTTGTPKGALLTHWNIASAALSGLQVLGAEPQQSVIAFLPMAHIYQRLVCLGMLMIGGIVAFSTPQTLADDFLRMRPDHMAAVPRVYEKLYKRIREEVDRRSPLKQRVYHWAERIAVESSRVVASGQPRPLGLRVKHRIADRLVYRQIRGRLGGKLKYAMSGASALPPRLAYLFNGMGFSVPEGYGLTETAAPANLNPPERIKPGTVGPPIPGVSEKLDEDGEILIKGPNVFIGYHNKSEETEAAFAEDGWFRSGDLGEFDEDGYLRILGRKKQIIALSTGKKVAPRPIEEALRAYPWIEDCMVIGDNRKFTAALIQPQFDKLVEFLRAEEIPLQSGVVQGKGPAGEDVVVEVPGVALEWPEVKLLFETMVTEVNESLDSHEKVKKFIILSRALNQERDEITPTLKKRREVIEANLKDQIEALYD